MIRIESDAWDVMVSHAQKTYPNECCGAMIGAIDGVREDCKRRGAARERIRRASRARATNCGRKICCEPTPKPGSAAWI